MELIRSSKEWNKYKARQNNRAQAFICIHQPDEPNEYPFIVLTSVNLDSKARFIHHFVSVEQAQELINAATKQKRQKASGSRK